MSWLEVLALLCAGAAAGLINTVVGSGTLITFPTLLAIGVPPVIANVSNTIGLAPGSLSGALSMRPELAGQRARVVRLGIASAIGGSAGAVLLLWLPPAAFRAIVPALIGIGCLLVIIQPALGRRLAIRRIERLRESGRSADPPRSLLPPRRPEPVLAPVDAQSAREIHPPTPPAHGSVWMWLGVLLTGTYGGYFGAAQGVLLLAVMGLGISESLVRINAVKNVLALIVNGIAGVIFIVLPLTPWASPDARVDWVAALTIAVGSVLGAQVGGRVGRRLPPLLYRVVIVCVGVAAIISLLLR